MKEKIKAELEKKSTWIITVTDNLAHHKIMAIIALIMLLSITVLSGYLSTTVFLILSAALAFYAILIALAFFRRGLRFLFDNQGNVYQLIVGYGLAVLGVIFLFTTIYATTDAVGLGYMTYGTCADKTPPGLLADPNSVQSFGGTFYFSAVTFFTIGYGDICPMGWDKGIAILNGFFGSVFTTIILAIAIAKYIRHERDKKE